MTTRFSIFFVIVVALTGCGSSSGGADEGATDASRAFEAAADGAPLPSLRDKPEICARFAQEARTVIRIKRTSTSPASMT